MAAVVDLTAPSPTREADDLEIEELVYDQIRNAPDSSIREILTDLCRKSPDIFKEVSERLLAPASEAHPRPGPDEESDEVEGRTGEDEELESSADKDKQHDGVVTVDRAKKRMRSRYETCVKCDESFDVTENYDGDCLFHEGELINEAEFPEHQDFSRWDCCDKEEGEEGCQIGAHEEMYENGKRPKY